MNAATSVPRARSRLVPVALWAAAATLLVLGGCAASRLRDAAALVRFAISAKRLEPSGRAGASIGSIRRLTDGRVTTADADGVTSGS